MSLNLQDIGDYMTDKARKLNETPYGKLPTGTPSKNACDAWQRGECLEARLQNDPESLLVKGRNDILECPMCGHKIKLEVNKNE